MDTQEKIELLSRRIADMAEQQSNMSRELVELIKELDKLKREAAIVVDKVVTKPLVPVEIAPSTPPPPPRPPVQKKSSSFEEIIGKNIASKVGILVTIVGIFIGARYAIEHNLVSPAVRIVSGYFWGAVLVGLAVYFKKKYEAYSAVLMGGGLAVLYFITYTAYGYYQLMPQVLAFTLMLIFTTAAVYGALVYNRVIIAHIGLVGAYAIPFLLSDNSGRYVILFSYISIINAGILVISFRKYWKSLFYSAFVLTWIIYGSWHAFSYNDEHFVPAFVFRNIFFSLFYVTFLGYKLVKKEKYGIESVFVILSNAFIFYGLGYNAVVLTDSGDTYTGLFTVINAAIHFGVSQLIRPRLVDKALYYLIFGLSLVFITIAVPVQFDGNWVTLLWIAEALLLFLVGRMQRSAPYEKGSSLLLVLTFISLIEDWISHSEIFEERGNTISPFVNITFVTGILVILAMGAMLYFMRNKKYPSATEEGSMFRNYYGHVVAVFFLLTAYVVFFIEIQGYFLRMNIPDPEKSFTLHYSEAGVFRYVITLLYSMTFAALVVFVNRRWVRSTDMNGASIAGIGLLVIIFLVGGLQGLNELSSVYFKITSTTGSQFGTWDLSLRYIVFCMMGFLLFMGLEISKSYGERGAMHRTWELIIHGVVLSVLSAEFLMWNASSGNDQQYKLGLTILWGIYALMLIVWGIYKKQKHLRLAAIALFVITLVKLFMYDLAESGTITKTVSFISLGAILLLVSYLYHRYKEVLFGKDD